MLACGRFRLLRLPPADSCWSPSGFWERPQSGKPALSKDCSPASDSSAEGPFSSVGTMLPAQRLQQACGQQERLGERLAMAFMILP